MQEFQYSICIVCGWCCCAVGVLVEAMRQGHWVILDELNLAPTEVLEALNRVRHASSWVPVRVL